MKLFRRRVWKYSKRATILIAIVAVLLLAGGGAVLARLGGFGTPANTSNIDLQKGLVGWWKMNGNAKDSTPYRNNGTLSTYPPGNPKPSLVADRKGAVNSAYSFNGSNSYITAGVNGMPDPHNAYSFSAWIYPTDTSGVRPIIDLRNSAGTLLEFEIRSGHLDVWGNGNLLKAGGTGCASCVVSANQWHHVVFSYPGASPWSNTSNWLLYIDGQQVFNGSSYPDGSAGAAYLFWIGHAYGATNYFSGTIDDMRVWKRVVSPAEVTALYNGYDASPQVAQGEKGLVGWWKMDGTLKDSSPYRTVCSQPYGNPNGSAGPDRKGRANSSYAPTNLGAQCGQPAALQVSKLTISAWVDSTSYNSSGNGIGGWGGVYDFSIGSGSLCLDLRDSSNQANYFCTTGTYALNTWYYVAATYDGSTVQLYVNGVPVAGGGSFAGIGTDHYGDSGNIFNLGVSGAASTTRRFMGYVDNLRVYNRALSSSEIANQYNSYDAHIAVGGSGQSGSVNLGKNLVGYWPMNGNAHDVTPYRNNGTINSATLTTDREGLANSAYSFDGSSAYIDVGNISKGLTGLTVSAWIYPTRLGVWQAIVSKGNNTSHSGGPRQWDLEVSDTNELYCNVRTNDGINTNLFVGNITRNSWQHVVLVFDGQAQTLKCYKNATLLSTNTTPTNTLYATATSVEIGRQATTGNLPDYFGGSIDDVRIYNRALSADEVQALYQEYN